MQTTHENQSIASASGTTAPQPYNYRKFRTGHFLYDLQATRQGRGIQPGEAAPDFCVPSTHGGKICLDDLRGKPVLLHFGSPT
ncbi:MAG: hypothetical protein ACO1SX_26960 [Actinomycetota bacterium]